MLGSATTGLGLGPHGATIPATPRSPPPPHASLGNSNGMIVGGGGGGDTGVSGATTGSPLLNGGGWGSGNGPSSFRALVNREGTLPHDSPRVRYGGIGGTPLIEVSGLDRRSLNFEGVFLNGLCSLRRFSLKNLSGAAVVVRLGSTLGDQLRWQLRNDNLNVMPADQQHLSTNTVGAVARLGCFPESNAVFDSIGLVSEVILQEGESKDIIAAFRPDPAHFQPSTISYDLSNPASANARVDGFSEHGLSSVSIAEDSSLSSAAAGISESKSPSQQQHNLTSIEGYVNLDASVIEPTGEQAANSTFVSVQQLSIEFHATCCRSVFAISAKDNDPNSDEIFLDFGNQCRVGELSTRECEVVNRSAVDLYWRIESSLSPFVLEDYDTGQLLVPGKLSSIAPYSSRRLRFHFRPTEVVEVDRELSFENVADPDNIVQIHLHASVTTAPVDNTLNVISGSSLDFGDCCSGEWSHQVIAFTNISPAPLEVTFGVDKGLEVTFRLETAATQEVLHDLGSSAIGANQVDLPPSIKETNSILRDLPPSGSGASRTIIHELSRGATLSSNLAHGRALLGATPRSTSTTNTRSPRSVQSDGMFASSGPSDDSSAPSVSDASVPKTYHPPLHRDVRSPLSGSTAVSTSTGTDQESSSKPAGDSRMEDPHPHPEPAPPVSRPTPGAQTRPESEGGIVRVQDRLKVLEQRQSAAFDQIYAKPGVLYRIIVSFRPTRASSPEGDGGRLVKKNFRINMSYLPWGSRQATGTAVKERKAILCKARICTSFVSVSPSTLDFGNVEIGTNVKGTISITNLSEIPARVDLRFISKVISAYRDEIVISVGSTVDVTVDMVPRRTNPAYRKQISVHNLLNPPNSAVCLLKAANVDTRGVAFHSLFYNLLTPTGGNFVEFGSVPIHSNALRAITIKNTSLAPIVLQLSPTHPEDYQLLVRKQDSDRMRESSNGASAPESPKLGGPTPPPSQPNGELKERVLDAIFQAPPTRPAESAAPPTAPSSSTSSKAACEAIATQLKEGLRGKPTQQYGNTVVFKDRGLLAHAEYLDLASGPPTHRTSPRSKRSFFDNERTTSRHRLPKMPFPPRPLGDTTSNSSSQGNATTRVPPGAMTSPPLPPSPDTSETKTKEVAPTTPTKRKVSRKQEALSSSSISPALTGRRKIRNIFPLQGDTSQLSLDEVLTALEHHAGHPDAGELSSWEQEDAYVKKYVALRRRLKSAITSEELVDVSKLEVAPQGERTIYILVHPVGGRINVQGSSRKQDGKISIQLLSYYESSGATGTPPTGPTTPPQDIPVREVVLRWTTFKSTMDLGMAHINFGQMEKSSSKTKTIVVANGSEKPLLYAVRKSGSIASGDLRVADGRHGIIAGYGKREVSITFEPHFAGTFEEVIHVDNVEDASESQSVRVKAFILRPPTFAISTTSVDFGPTEIGVATQSKTVSVTNTSKASRSFTVGIDPADFQFQLSSLEVVLKPSAALVLPKLTSEEEEEVESVLQKLKISRRKGQPEKEEKYITRLKALGVPVPAAEPSASSQSSPIDPNAAFDPTADASGISLAGLSSLSIPEAMLAAKDAVVDAIKLVTSPKAEISTPELPAVATPATAVAAAAVKGKPSDASFGTNLKSSITFTLEANARRDFAVVITPRPILPALDASQTYEDVVAPIWVTENADSRASIAIKTRVLLTIS
ncbi:hypothetical protein T439DRAFT_320211 [Meredithblackwellia eburnea MCA 4105]